MHKDFGKTIDLLADRCVGSDDRQRERANGGQYSLRVFSRIVRPVDYGVREKRAHSHKHRGHPPVGKMPGVPGQRDSKKREHGQYAGLRSDEEMAQCRLAKLTLNHEQETGSPRFDRFVAAERQTKLVFLVYEPL